MIGDDAFETLENAYSYRGTISKRDGSVYLSTTALSNAWGPSLGDITAFNSAVVPPIVTVNGHRLVLGTTYTIGIDGITAGLVNPLPAVPPNPPGTGINGVTFQALAINDNTFSLTTDAKTPGALDLTTWTAWAAGGRARLAIQSLVTNLIPTSLDEQLWAMTRRLASIFNNTTTSFDTWDDYLGLVPSDPPGPYPLRFTGGEENPFWFCNYADSMWVTNNINAIHYYQVTAGAGPSWNGHTPVVNLGSGAVLTTALIILPYKGRLLVLNTTENGVVHRNRARFSQVGTPYTAGVPAGAPPTRPPANFTTLDPAAWHDDVPGRGGYIDADTSEAIVSAAIVSDTLMVFFERSTWRLRYTGNQVLPFVWERVDLQYGSEATFSTVVVENTAFAFSRFGFIAGTPNEVARIDREIPELSYQIETGALTAAGQLSQVQATRDLYKRFIYWTYPPAETNDVANNRVVAYNYDDKSWQIFKQAIRCFGRYKTFVDRTWAGTTTPWSEQNYPWNYGGLQSNFPEIVGGTRNGTVVKLYNKTTTTKDNDTRFNFDIATKRFTPYMDQGKKCRLEYVDLYVTNSPEGEITLEHYVDDMDTSPPAITRTVSTSSSKFTDGKYTRVFLGATSAFHQIRLLLSDTQLAPPPPPSPENPKPKDTGAASFEMRGMVLWSRPEGRVKDL